VDPLPPGLAGAGGGSVRLSPDAVGAALAAVAAAPVLPPPPPTTTAASPAAPAAPVASPRRAMSPAPSSGPWAAPRPSRDGGGGGDSGGGTPRRSPPPSPPPPSPPASAGAGTATHAPPPAGPIPPSRDTLLVFLGSTDADTRPLVAVAAAAAAGYHVSASLEGGLACFGRAPSSDGHHTHTLTLNPSPSSSAAALASISRDALAVALCAAPCPPPPTGAAGEQGGRGQGEGARPPTHTPALWVVDVRRGDEVALYGRIPGSIPVPAALLPAAARLSPSAWEAAHRCAQPGPGSAVVLVSRQARRAAWAAQAGTDAGWGRCLVFRPGVCGWRGTGAAAPAAYGPWAAGAAPPEPWEDAAAGCGGGRRAHHQPPVDGARAAAELGALGLGGLAAAAVAVLGGGGRGSA
jgi:rhodanese-related sulfurtransferase